MLNCLVQNTGRPPLLLSDALVPANFRVVLACGKHKANLTLVSDLLLTAKISRNCSVLVSSNCVTWFDTAGWLA